MLGPSDSIQLKNIEVKDADRNSPLYHHVPAHTGPQGTQRESTPERCTPQN